LFDIANVYMTKKQGGKI